MINLFSALPLLIGLAQAPQQSESLAREQINGPLGVRLDTQMTRFAEYG